MRSQKSTRECEKTEGIEERQDYKIGINGLAIHENPFSKSLEMSHMKLELN
jgi:hypothetical protein